MAITKINKHKSDMNIDTPMSPVVIVLITVMGGVGVVVAD
jgi:hypothetical protein